MQPVTDPAVSAFVLGLVVLAGVSLVGWLLSRQVKAFDDRMAQGAAKMAELTKGLAETRETLIRIEGRMTKAEAEISNDKQGRAAFVQMQHDLGRVLEAVGHLASGLAELKDRFNAMQDIPPVRRGRRALSAAE